MSNTRRKFNMRGMVSFLVSANFLISTLTGLALYVTPQGRIAFWTDWRLVGLTKAGWQNLHLFTGLVFIIAGAFHLYFNWKPLMHYLYSKATHHLNLKREMVVAGIIVTITVIASILQLPPVSYVFDLNERIKQAWIRTPADEPPFGHAEEASFRSLAHRLGLEEQPALAALDRDGITVEDPTQSLAEIARRNGTNPADVYRRMGELSAEVEPPSEAVDTNEARKRLEQLEGRGLGRMTVEDVARAVGISAEQATAQLATRGIDYTAGEKLKQIGERHDLTPRDVARAMLETP